MPGTTKHHWEFVRRFGRQAFDLRGSRPVIERIKEAIAEIKKVARKDQMLAAEGTARSLDKVLPALEQIDSSSVAIAEDMRGGLAVLGRVG